MMMVKVHMVMVALVMLMVVLSLLMGGHISDHVMGIFVGHIFFFFNEVYPLMPTSKGFKLFRTPGILKTIFRQE